MKENDIEQNHTIDKFIENCQKINIPSKNKWVNQATTCLFLTRSSYFIKLHCCSGILKCLVFFLISSC